MADTLADLPYPKSVQYTTDEVEAHTLFTPANPTAPPQKDFKYLVLYTSILVFILLSSFADDFVKRIPYCDSELSRLIVKLLIFVLAFTVIYYWLV